MLRSDLIVEQIARMTEQFNRTILPNSTMENYIMILNTFIPARPNELTRSDLASRLNWLRAGVLGANDGIVSVAAIVVGVVAVTTNAAPIFTAGVAALVGGGVSMALGEYVSVSSQRDSQRALVKKRRSELVDQSSGELVGRTSIYHNRGLIDETARQVATELTEHDALAARPSTELNIERDDLASPWNAALASAVSFSCGATLPLLAVLLSPAAWRIPVTFIAVLSALAVTGAVGAYIGGGSRGRAAIRVVAGGAVALAATFLIGKMLGATGLV
jgi:vacuolar iron transporter family protein